MKKRITSKYLLRLLFTLFWVFAFHSTSRAQSTSGTYISWNNQVGCISYDSEGEPDDQKKRIIFIEDIENSPCIRVCEGSTVTYAVNGTGISSVQWSAAGGSIVSVTGAGGINATVNWGAVGSAALDITINYSNGTQKHIVLCVEIINSPKAIFSFYGIGQDPVFCLNTAINFQNLSDNNGGTEIVYYQWDFGDGTYSNAFEPSHSYSQSGNYQVTLTVTNSCNCSSVFTMDVKIEDRPNIIINCASVVCEGDEKVSYTVDDKCDGQWEVVGGTIAGQYPGGIDVTWNNVDDDGFGYVSYRSDCTCPFWTTIKIPVVKQKGLILGNAVLCLNEQGLYTLPQWPTTDFHWTLTSVTNPTTTTLVYVDQRNQVIIDALQAGDYVLRCEYNNTLLGCVGNAEMRIKIISGTVITGPDTLCSGISTTYATTGGGTVDWELKMNNTVVASLTAATFTYSFPTGGVYTLTAVSGGCSGQPKVITVTQRPSTPTGPIVGEIKICPGVPYEYTLTNTEPNTVLVWSVNDGTFQGDNTGNNVTIVFNNTTLGQYTISVVKRSLDPLGCVSAAINLNVTKIVVSPTITNGSGLSVFCPSSQTTFTANLNGITPDQLEWSVVPANFGNIISGANANTVTVSWNEISTSATGTLQLKVKKCGVDQIFNTPITLQATPVLTLAPPAPICYGSNLTLTLTSSVPLTSGTINWNFGNGTTATSPVSSTSTYSFPNPYNNATGTNVNYSIVATLVLPNGCNSSPTAAQSIVVYPKTTITVTPGYNYTVCPTSYTPFTLSANATTGIGVTVNYQWFKGASLISGATASTYTISGTSPAGTYYVRVTDSNNCVVNSQTITVNASCVPPNPCSISPDPNVTLAGSWSACGTISATLSYVGTATVQWLGSPFISLISGNTAGAQFSTNVPGAHLVTALVTFSTPSGPCTVTRTVEVKTYYKPNFNTNIVCNGNGSYNVTLLNNSTIFDVTASNPITYTFSGTGMSTQVGQTINLTNLAPGTYNYTLTLTMAGKPSCNITKTVVLSAMPNVAFSLAPLTYCAEEQIGLTIPAYNSVNTYKWLFNGTSYIASNATTLININAPGTYPIRLQATTPLGCVLTSNPISVTILKASFSGSLVPSPSASICEGTAPAQVISFVSNVSGNPMPSSYIWMKGNQQVATSVANSYTPTVSGSYWAILVDANGCKFNGLQPVSIIIRQRPYAGIVGTTTICSGEQTVLQGVVTNTLLQRRWLLNGSPIAGTYGTWSATTPLSLTVSTTTPGTYTYSFEVRPVSDTSCGSTATTIVTVNPIVTAPALSYTVLTCEPYNVQVTASGPASGNYNWTTGDTGQTIEIGYGGAVGVTYTAPTGCKADAVITIPQPTDRSLWVFPTGCYDLCIYTTPVPYIIGPLGTFDYYEWLVNTQVAGSGTNSPIQSLVVDQAGAYQLTIDNDGCTFESGMMYIAPDLEKCDYKECNIKAAFKDEIGYENGVYLLYGDIFNPNSVAITVTITSFNNYGTYSPNVITIPANSNYSIYPLIFTPNSNFTGGNDYIIIQMEGCMTVYKVRFPEIQQGRAARSKLPMEEAVINVVPNPTSDITSISYNLGSEYKNAETLIVYNLLGVPLITQKLDKPSGQAQISTLNLASGTYIISIQADGARALQQTLIKK